MVERCQMETAVENKTLHFSLKLNKKLTKYNAQFFIFKLLKHVGGEKERQKLAGENDLILEISVHKLHLKDAIIV